MTGRDSGSGPSLPRSAFLLASPPRALLPAGWVTVGEAIAWVGFAQASPVQRWDLDLALGLSLWPWYPPHAVQAWLHHLATTAMRGAPPYTKGVIRGHRIWLRAALLELGSHWFPPPQPSSPRPGQPDERVRAEAARRHDAWDEATEAEVRAAFRAATLASDALCFAIAEGKIAAFGVPAGTKGTKATRAQRQVAPEACAAPVTLTPDGLFPFTLNNLEPGSTAGPSFTEMLLPGRNLARAFPRAPGRPPDLLAAALGREPEPGEADAMAAQQDQEPGLIARTGSPGRPPMSRELYMREHRRRLASGEAFADLTEEAKYLLDVWLPTRWPGASAPTFKTLKGAIAPEHRERFGQPRLKDGASRRK